VARDFCLSEQDTSYVFTRFGTAAQCGGDFNVFLSAMVRVFLLIVPNPPLLLLVRAFIPKATHQPGNKQHRYS
jgi:hypothetical protein